LGAVLAVGYLILPIICNLYSLGGTQNAANVKSKQWAQNSGPVTTFRVLWVVTPYSGQIYMSTSKPHSVSPEDGGSKVVRHVDILPYHFTVS